MSIGEITALLRQGILEVIIIAAPFLVSALLVGLVVAILQASTSIQEQTLTFVPKLIAILAVLALLGSFMFSSLGEYTINLFRQIPDMAR
ncbi:MAG: flagellar biosynthesis protein FliQ [Spirochaetes bacterium]|nr:flagellar biosynthesis protein FliQ [Brevinematales bacterium]MCL1959338.1 flagellar biosynthesis protein FliQ [Spirochaetota bacterium]